MTKRKPGFIIVDILYLSIAILPLLFGMALKIFTNPAESGISIHGARIFFKAPFILGGIVITETQINSLVAMLFILGMALFLTHGISKIPNTKRQFIAEWAVSKVEGLVGENMGQSFMNLVPFIMAILSLSAVSSLLTLIGIYPPTCDVNTIAGWALTVILFIEYYRFKCGPWGFIKSFLEPLPPLAPLNLIGEVATPFAMTLRHFGNVLSGSIIGALIAAFTAYVSKTVFGALPGILSEIPFFQIGIPAFLSLYFDLFSGCLQAFIFSMLAMLNISSAFDADGFEKRRAKREAKLKLAASQNSK
ncbi:MAG: F0F1 ATP synthase subunit A [Clostridia bacterium]|nr:F0F1 ATP synthase subunit A [Clostridia bacterium]